jgi:hypothetical protein
MDAAKIFQDYLDEVSKAVMADDWEAYRDGICLPCHIISHDESKVVETEDDLRAGFDLFRDTLRAQQVTDYIRLMESAARLDQALISGKYVTHLLSGGRRVMPPFKSQMTLRLMGNRWRAASVSNALANSHWPLVRLEVHPDDDLKGPET